MAKALKTIGTAIVFAGAVVATGGVALAMSAGVGIGGALGLASGTLASMGGLSITASGLVKVGLLTSAVASSLDRPKVQSSGAAIEWAADPDAPMHFAAGRIGVAGQIVHCRVFGPDNMFVGFVNVVSGAGPIRRFVSFKADDSVVTFDASGKANSSYHANVMWRRPQLGAQPELSALPSPLGLKNGVSLPDWGAAYRLSGKAGYMYTLAENSKQSAYRGKVPTGLNVIEGLFGWDPRQDSTWPGGSGPCRLNDPSTWVWIENPILWALKWSLGLWEGPTGKGAPQVDYQVGGIGAKVEGIHVASFVEAANVADARGWKVAAWPSTDDSKASVLDSFLQAGGAIYADKAGKIACVHRAAPRPSIVTITGADTAGPLEIDTATSRINRINTIRPRYWSEAHDWQMTATDEVTAEAYQIEDGQGVAVKRTRGIDFNYVPEAKQAGELSRLQIANTREGIQGVIPLRPYMQGLEIGDCITITEPDFVLDGLKCLVLNVDDETEADVIRVSFVSETDTKYPWAFGEVTNPPPPQTLVPSDPTYVSPPNPEDFIVIPRMPGEDGVQVPIIDIEGEVSNATATAVLVEWGYPPDPPAPDPLPTAPEGERQPVFADYVNWQSAGTWPVTATGITLNGIQPGATYYVAFSYVRGGNVSERTLKGPEIAPGLVAGDVTHIGGVPIGNIPSLDTTPPDAPTGVSLSTPTSVINGETVASVAAVWEANTEADLNGYEVEVSNLGFTVIDYAATNAWRRDAVIGQSYSIRVRALDKAGNRSGWTTLQAITASGDMVPPAAPTGLSAQSTPGGTIFLEWSNPTAADLRRVIVFESNTNNSATASRLAEVVATPALRGSYTRGGLTAGDVRYYWLKAEDTSGNLSGFSAAAAAAVPGIGGGDIDTTPPAVPGGLSLATSVLSGLGDPVVRVVAAWSAVTDADLAGYEVEWKEGSSNPVVRGAGTNRDEIVRAISGVVYQARVRAFDGVGNKSAWSAWASVTAATDTVAPAPPISLTATNSLGAIFLRWANAPDADLSEVEVFESDANNSAAAVKIATVNALPGQPGGYARSGMVTGSTRYYWLKSVDTSGNRSGFSAVISRTLTGVGNEDVSVGTLTGDRLVAGSVEGTVFKTTTSLPGTMTIGTTGVQIGTVESRAADPAARINANTTQIDPGKVVISGSTTLANWRGGTDTTRINGGALETNSVKANSLEIGNRGLTFDRFNFTTSGNTLSWTTGRVTYVDDAGNTISSDLSGGSITWTGSGGDCLYLYWVKGAGIFGTTYNGAVARSASSVIVGTYYGGTNFTASYGRTLVDGDYVKTGTLDTIHLKALSITTTLLATDAVTASKLAADAVYARNIVAQQVTMDKLAVTGALPISLTMGPGGATIGQMNTTQQVVIAIQSDAVLSRSQKPALIRQYADMSEEYASLQSLAASLGISSAAFVASFVNVTNYLSSLAPAWSDTSQDTTIVPATFNARFADYASAREALMRSAVTIDPTIRINAGSTTILPGKILLSGGSTLASWQFGGDTTQINGGAVAANTLRSNTAEIGSRGVTFDRFNFTTSGNTLSWSVGRATYVADSGAAMSIDVAGGSYAYSASGGDVTYLYWTQGATSLSTTKSITVAKTNAVLVAAYYGGTTFTATYGRTMIDGDHISVPTLSAISADIGNVTAGRVGNSAGTTFFDLTNARQQFQVGAYVWRQGAIGSGVITWFGPSSITIGTETRTNGAFALGTDGIVYYGSAPLETGGNMSVTNDFGQTKGGSGYASKSGATFVRLFGATLTGVVSGQVISAAMDWPNITSGNIAYEVRLVQSSTETVIAGPFAYTLLNGNDNDAINLTGTATASGSSEYRVDIRITSGGALGANGSTPWTVARFSNATPSQGGYMSATQASQLAALVAGGGGGGPPLATTPPPAINVNTTGVSASAARSDHSHAHGNQSGGSQHAIAVPGGAAGFLSGTGAYYLSTPTASDVPNSLAWRDGAGNSSFNAGYALSWNIGGRSIWGEDDHFRSNVSIYATSFVPTCDLNLKTDIVSVDDAAALNRVLQIEALEYVRLEDGASARGLGAQGLRDICDLYVVGDELKTTSHYIEPAGPCQPGQGLPPYEVRTPVLNPENGEQERTPLGVDFLAIIADMTSALRVMMSELGSAQSDISHLKSLIHGENQ